MGALFKDIISSENLEKLRSLQKSLAKTEKRSALEKLEDFTKAGREGLVPKKVRVTRGGKTFEVTRYVRPSEVPTREKKRPETQREDSSFVLGEDLGKIKQYLVSNHTITGYDLSAWDKTFEFMDGYVKIAFGKASDADVNNVFETLERSFPTLVEETKRQSREGPRIERKEFAELVDKLRLLELSIEQAKTRADKVTLIDRLVSTAHRHEGTSLIPKMFDMKEAMEAGDYVREIMDRLASEEKLEKSFIEIRKANRGELVPKKVRVTRAGKTFERTQMVSPEEVPAVPEVTIPELSRLEAEGAVQGLVNELRQVRQQRIDGTISQIQFLEQQRDIARRVIEVEPLDIAKETWRDILARTEAELAKPPAVKPEREKAPEFNLHYTETAVVSDEYKSILTKTVSSLPKKYQLSHITVAKHDDMPEFDRGGKRYKAGGICKRGKIMLSDGIEPKVIPLYVAHEVSHKIYKDEIMLKDLETKWEELIKKEDFISDYARSCYEGGKKSYWMVRNPGLDEAFAELAANMTSATREETKRKFPGQAAFFNAVIKGVKAE